jgi:site-specific recombinase XerD
MLLKTDDREALIQSVLDGLTSPHSRRAYDRALTAFLNWHTEQGQPPLTKAVVNAYKSHLVASGKGAAAINQSLSAIRKLVQEGADNGAIEPALAAGIARVKGLKNETLPAGRSISAGELTALLTGCANDPTPAGARDAALLALLYAGGLRRAELVGLARADYDETTGELKILHAKGRKQRTAHLSGGARAALADWLAVRGEAAGPLFVPLRRGGHLQGRPLTAQAVYHILSERAKQVGVRGLSPHDFRRTFVGDLLDAGADIATVQRMAGHADVSTTARYDRRGEEAKRKAAGLLHVPYVPRSQEK